MSANQLYVRMQAQGGSEVVSAVKRVEEAVVRGADAGAASNARASEAAIRHAQALKVLERDAMAVGKTLMQARIEAMAGSSTRTQIQDQLVVRGRSSSLTSAAVALASREEGLDRRAAAIKQQIDPLGAAQDRLNGELREYDALLKANRLTVTEHARAQAIAKTRFDETALAIQRQERGLTRLALASRLNLSRQAADVFTTAAMGMNPAMIAIQQGPQIMDAWATSAIKLSPALLGVSAAIGLTAAGFAVATYGYLRVEGAMVALDRAATGLGRTAGLTGTQLAEMARQGAEAGEISRSAAARLAAAYVSTGRIGGAILTDLIAVTKDWAAFTNVDLVKAQEDLAESMSKPDEAARNLTRRMGLLDQKTLEHIDTLVEAGKQAEVQRILLDAISAASAGHAEKVTAMGSAWDYLGQKISNAVDGAGRWLMVTDDERLEALRRRAEGGPWGPGDPAARQQYDRLMLARSATASMEDLRALAYGDAAENQSAQDEKDRQDAGRRDRERAAREAERRAREALARQRREEDRIAAIDMQVARAGNDFDAIQRLERENALRSRTRELIDDGVSAERARTRAIEERAPLERAMAEASQRERQAVSDQVALETQRMLGNHEDARIHQDRVDREARILEYRRKYLGLVDAERAATHDLLQLADARATVQERELIAAERTRQIALARARGDDRTLRGLEREDWIASRTREIARSHEWNEDDGRAAAEAARQWAQHWDAEMEGARRRFFGNLIDDVRRYDAGDVLARQLEKAADRFGDRLAEQLARIRWGEMLEGTSFGVFGRGLDWFLGTGGADTSALTKLKIGRNAAGTDDWRGGWTLLGEHGPEVGWLPERSKVFPHGQSMQMLRQAVAPAASVSVTLNTTINADGASPEVVPAINARLDQLRAEVPRLAVQAVAEARSRGGKI